MSKTKKKTSPKTNKRTPLDLHDKAVALMRKPKAVKMGFWVARDVMERVRDYVDQHRNAPDNLTLNAFVRQAIESALKRAEKKAA